MKAEYSAVVGRMSDARLEKQPFDCLCEVATDGVGWGGLNGRVYNVQKCKSDGSNYRHQHVPSSSSKGGRRGKVSAGGKQLRGKQKGKKKQRKRRKKEEEGEEKKYPRGRAAHSLAYVDSSS